MSRYRQQDNQNPRLWLRILQSFLCNKRAVVVAILIIAFCYVLTRRVTTPSHAGRSNTDSRYNSKGLHENSLKVNSEGSRDAGADNARITSTISSVAKIEKEFEKRRQLYEKACVSKKEGRVSELFLHPPSKLSVCHVQKVGCTFWKRLFRYLYRDFGDKDAKSLFDIDRVLVHFGGSKTFKTYNYKKPEGRLLADAGTKVMFTRDPYRRLWSGYVDKFILPDSWLDHGRAIVFARKKPSSRKDCSDDIQFEEFLSYTLRNYDDHWKPIADICDPCTYRPKFVGHMETFGTDVKYILDSRGLGYLLENHDHHMYMQDEIRILVDYHFQLYHTRKYLEHCLSPVQLASRLWKVFQINGFFKMDHNFPQSKIEKTIKDLDVPKSGLAVTKTFLDEFLDSPNTEEEWKAQREANLVNAYRQVSKDVKFKLAKRFQADFDLFGFDPKSPDEVVEEKELRPSII